MRRVVIVGGGYAGLHAFQVLNSRLRPLIRRGEASITLVAKDPYHTYHGWTGEVLSGRLSPERTLSDILGLVGDSFLLGEATGVDTAKRVVSVRTKDGTQDLPYDHLMVGIGSIDPLSRIPGSREHAWRLKDTHDMQALSQHLDAGSPGRVVVVGGGLAGVETASALALRLGRGVVSIVSGSRPPLADLLVDLPRMVRHARSLLEDQGVSIISGVRVSSVDAAGVNLTNGDSIPARMTIVAAGVDFPSIPGLETLLRDQDGRILVDRALRAVGAEGVWAAGDIAKAMHPGRIGGFCPVDALWAMKQGDHVGASIADTIQGRRVRNFGFKGMGRAAGLAGTDGVSELYGVEFTGRLAWLLRMGFFAWYMPYRARGFAVLWELLRLKRGQAASKEKAVEGAGA